MIPTTQQSPPPFLRGLEIAAFILAVVTGFLLGWGNSWTHQTAILANTTLGLALASLGVSSCVPRWRMPTSMGGVLLLVLLALYLCFSIVMNVGSLDLHGHLHTNNLIWWGNYAKICFAAGILGVSFYYTRTILAGVGSFCAGAFSVALLFSINTIVTTGNSVYGAINNPLDGVVINSAGIMSLAIFLPAFISSLAFYRPLLSHHGFWAIVMLVYAAGSSIGYAFNSRSVFLFLYGGLLVQALALVALNRPKNWRSLLVVFAGLTVFLALIFFMFFHLRRPISDQLFTDPRFAMAQAFVLQLWDTPLTHARVPVEIQLRGGGTHFFHNFFADAHRLSGFFSFLFAVLLAVWAGVLTLWSAFLHPTGRVLLFTLFPTALILNSSVVPEGEFQPLILLLLLGGAAAGLVRTRQRVPCGPTLEK